MQIKHKKERGVGTWRKKHTVETDTQILCIIALLDTGNKINIVIGLKL